MSELVVEVCEVTNVIPMENSDFLEQIMVKGWPIVVQKALKLKPGDPVIFFPPDSVMSEGMADRLGIKKYLAPVKVDQSETRYRVRATRLRGVASYGTIDHDVPDGLSIGDDVAELYGITKWEPPVRNSGIGGLKGATYRTNINPEFHKYVSIEHLRNHRSAFKDGELVVITEKIHGSSVRVALLKSKSSNLGFFGRIEGLFRKFASLFVELSPRFELVAGSHNVQRDVRDQHGNLNEYAMPLANKDVVRLLYAVSSGKHDVILFGEIYGSGVQDMTYGNADGKRSFAAFDITVDGKYLDAEVKYDLFERYGIPIAPILYIGPFSWDVVNDLTDGPTTLCEPSLAGPFKGREGIVVTRATEPTDYPGRKIFKCVSADYLARSNQTDCH